MTIIVGLGNPGDQYKDTKHNIGYMVLAKLSHELGTGALFSHEKKFDADIVRIADTILVLPTTFMNASGVAVRKIMAFYTLTPKDVWVIHDDMDLPMGKIRIRLGGSSAGHHGVDSLIKELGTDSFLRFRLGIGRGKENTGVNADRHIHRRTVISFVLSRFTQHDAGKLKVLVKHGADAVRIALTEGTDKAMGRYN
jgi:PTH1 family peptidyl-tRNA hydrolase